MTWVSDPTLAELTSDYQHYHFLLRILRAVAPYDGFSPHEVIIETAGDYAPYTVFIGCGLLFGSWDDREEVTPENIELLERTRKELIELGCMYDFAELFACRSRGKLPLKGIEEYGASRHLFEEIIK